ncbi:MAG: FG-GAP-like repeat-containing protein [Bacteroidota bacterium]
MHKSFPHFARKRRQILNLESKLERWLKEGRWWQMTAETRQKWLQKLKARLQAFRAAGHLNWAKPALVAALLGLGLQNNLQAQSFNPPQQNPFGLTAGQYFSIPTMVDIDADGDLDLFVGTGYGNIQYFQNTGTAMAPTFAAPQTNPFGLQSAYYFASMTFADLDMDGDLDLLVGEYYGNLQYYQNTGTNTAPAFATPQQNPFGLTATFDYAFPSFGDLDGDGDYDLIVGEYYGNLQYFQNTGTQTAPAFAAPQANPFGLTASTQDFMHPRMTDLDGDGDLDILAGEYYGDVKYYENTGTQMAPAFGAVQTNPFGLQAGYNISFVSAGDLDGDGDLDVLIGEIYGNLQYYENVAGPVGNIPPTVGTIANQTLCLGDTIGPIMFNASDANGDPLSLFATSSNQALLTDANIQISGMAPNYQLTGIPTMGQTGSTTITLNVSDGMDTTTTSFMATYSLCNSSPVLSGPSDQTICSGDTISSLAFTASDPDNDSFSLTATSNNQTLIPDGNIQISGTAPNFTIEAISVLGQIGTAQITVVANDSISPTSSFSFNVQVNLCNTPPVFGPIGAGLICVDEVFGPVSFTLDDPDGDPLSITASSNNQALIPDGNIQITGSTPNYDLTAVPLAGQSGSAILTLTADDGISTSTRTVVVQVDVCNDPPVISPIGDQNSCLDFPFGPINVTVTDPDGDPITLTAASSNTAFLPNNAIVIGGASPTFTLFADPVNGFTGPVDITLTASDGTDQSTETFTLTVDNCTNIDLPAFAQSMKLYPNPVSSQVRLDFVQLISFESVEVLDLSGRLVQLEEVNQFVQSYTLDLAEMPEGVYFLRIQAEGTSFIRKFVKQ